MSKKNQKDNKNIKSDKDIMSEPLKNTIMKIFNNNTDNEIESIVLISCLM